MLSRRVVMLVPTDTSSAIQTFTSGKRNDLEDLGIVQFQGSRAFRTYDDRRVPTPSDLLASPLEFQFDHARRINSFTELPFTAPLSSSGSR